MGAGLGLNPKQRSICFKKREKSPERPSRSTRHGHLAAGATQTLSAHARSSRDGTSTSPTGALRRPPIHCGRYKRACVPSRFRFHLEQTLLSVRREAGNVVPGTVAILFGNPPHFARQIIPTGYFQCGSFMSHDAFFSRPDPTDLMLQFPRIEVN
jgi:hypothetical protein